MEIKQDDDLKESSLFFDNTRKLGTFTMAVKCDGCGYKADNISLLKKHKIKSHNSSPTEE